MHDLHDKIEIFLLILILRIMQIPFHHVPSNHQLFIAEIGQ